MKRIIFLLVLFILATSLLAVKQVKIYSTDERNFTGQLLCSSDSLLYIWTGLTKFDCSKLDLIKAIPYSQIKKIDFSLKKNWLVGIKQGFPFTSAATICAAVTKELVAIRSKDGAIIVAWVMLNIAISIPVGAIISLTSHFPRKLENPSYNDFKFDNGKYSKYLILKKKDIGVINKIISEV